MDKKKKMILLMIVPVVVVLLAFVLFQKLSGNNTIAAKDNDQFIVPDVNVNQDTSAKTKMEIYKKQQLREEEKERKYQKGISDDDFFNSVLKEEVQDTTPVEEEFFEEPPKKSSNTSRNSGGGASTKKSYEYNPSVKNRVVEPTVQETPATTKRRRVSGTDGSFSKTGNTNTKTSNIISAVIHNGDKSVKSGSTVRLRLVENCTINGTEIPKNTMISGIASLSNERIKITVSSIKYNNEIFPCKLTVYDNDGIEGIFIPGGITQETKESVSSSTASEVGKHIPLVGGVASDVFKKTVKEPSALIYDNHKITLRQ